MGYELTGNGRKKCESILPSLRQKRKEILDAKLDTSEYDYTDYTPEEIFSDLLSYGIDHAGDNFNAYGVTDNYNADYVLGLTMGIDFVEK